MVCILGGNKEGILTAGNGVYFGGNREGFLTAGNGEYFVVDSM